MFSQQIWAQKLGSEKTIDPWKVIEPWVDHRSLSEICGAEYQRPCFLKRKVPNKFDTGDQFLKFINLIMSPCIIDFESLSFSVIVKVI